MDIFLLTPIKEHLNEQYLDKFKTHKLIIDSQPKNLLEVSGIKSKRPKILAIDIDFRPEDQRYISKEILEQIPNIKGVAVSSTSYSWIDTNYLKERNIPFYNCPSFSSDAVAEWGVMMSLMLARKYVPIQNSNHQFTTELLSTGLNDRRVGIIGLGEIGSAYAKKIKLFSKGISYWSRSKKQVRHKYSTIKNIFKTSDLIYFSLVKDKDFFNLVKPEYLKFLSTKAIVVSAISLPKNIHEELISKVNLGEIYGYGFEGKVAKRYKNKNILATPSFAWYTGQSITNNLDIWYSRILEVLKQAKT